MSEEPSRPNLTADQIIYVYERQLNRIVIWHLLGGFLMAGLAVALLFLIETLWLKVALVVLAVVAGMMMQRLIVLRLRCPSCGARVLGRIHSIVQAPGIRSCPRCEVKLRR